MCAQRICGLKVSSKHTHCVICTCFGKKGDNCLLFTSGHYSTHNTSDNYLLFPIWIWLASISCKYLHPTGSNCWRSMAAKISLKSPRKGRRPALHRPTYLDCRFAHNSEFDYLYGSCYSKRFFSWKILWGLRGLKIHFLWIISWSPTTLTTHILGPYVLN